MGFGRVGRWVRGRVREMARWTFRNYFLAGGVRTAAAEPADLMPNPYPTREEQVGELLRKFEGSSDWGQPLVQRIVDYKASYAAPQGVRWRKATDAPAGLDAGPELEFARRFSRWNNVTVFAQDMVQEAVLQAQNLVTLSMNLRPEALCPDLKYVAWYDTRYTVAPAAADDYSDFAYAEYERPGVGPVRVPRGRCAFVAWGALKNRFEGHPALGGVIRHLERLDMCLECWHLMNVKTGKLTPVIDGIKDQREADDIAAKIRSAQWKLAQFLATSGNFKIVGPTGITDALLERFIVRDAGLISGATGVPPQHLGVPDLLANRATAENTGEPGEVIAAREEARWRWWWTTIMDYAIGMRNEYLSPPLRTGVIEAHIPRYSRQRVLDAQNMVIPAFEKGLLTRREARAALPMEIDEGTETENVQ